MQMKERTFVAQDYTYGFNGQEQDGDLMDGAVVFKYRIHDPRIGRFLSVDPLAPEYPWNSAYAFAENQVISSIDLEGAESYYEVLPDLNEDGYTVIKFIVYADVFDNSKYINNTVQLKEMADPIGKQLEKSYQGVDHVEKVKYITEVNLSYPSGKPAPDGYYYEMVDVVLDDDGNPKHSTLGRVDKISSPNINRMQVQVMECGTFDDGTPFEGNYVERINTGIHEFGHTVGLRHPTLTLGTIRINSGYGHDNGVVDETEHPDNVMSYAGGINNKV
jgi:RHS repeat-associated protein